jgi:hypothetical protein
MGDLEPVFLQFADKSPSQAGCSKCHLKFFTPSQLMRQPQAAVEYLREKFALHTCKGFEQARAGTMIRPRDRIVKHTDNTSSMKKADRLPRGPHETWKYFAHAVIHEENPEQLTHLIQQLYRVLNADQ